MMHEKERAEAPRRRGRPRPAGAQTSGTDTRRPDALSEELRDLHEAYGAGPVPPRVRALAERIDRAARPDSEDGGDGDEGETRRGTDGKDDAAKR